MPSFSIPRAAVLPGKPDHPDLRLSGDVNPAVRQGGRTAFSVRLPAPCRPAARG